MNYNNNRNGGGYTGSGYGGSRNQKRKPEGDFQPYYKKPRVQEEAVVDEPVNVVAEDELELLIFKLGDKNDIALESRLESLVSLIDIKMATDKDEIQHLLYECISKLPEKYTLYATLLGLVNIKNYNFVVEFVEKIAKNLKECLRNGNFFVGYRLIRFISNLVNVNVITAKSLFEIFEQFLALTTEPNLIQARTDFYVHSILSSLPYCAKELYDKHGPQFDELMHSIENYIINKRKKPYLELLKVWSSDEPHPQEEYIDCLWIQMKKLEENDWHENILFRPYKRFEAILKTSISHEFPLIIPPEHHDKIIYPTPRVVFRLFDYTDVPEEFILPGAHSIERYLVEDQLNLILDTYFLERKICAQQLLQANIINKMPLHYIIVEVIFGQLFTLPKTPHIELFYGSLLIELCRFESTIFPQTLAQATELLFDRLDTMKASCVERFAKWFSYHLSNFQFRWSWDDWKQCVEEDLESPKCKFIKETLLNCMRLSYHQRIAEMMPETMQCLTPAEPVPIYKYESEDAVNLEGTAIANKLLELMRNRCLPEDVLQVLREVSKPDDGMEQEEINEEENQVSNPLKIDVFTSTLLYFGSKSLSHIFAALAKFHMIFKLIVEDEESQILVIKTLYEVWKNNQQMTVIMVDKMLKIQIIECSSIADWVFSNEMKHELTSFYVWEILNSTVNRMNIQVDKLQNDFNEFEDNLKKSLNNEHISLEGTQEDVENELKLKHEHLQILREQQRQLFFIIIKHFSNVINDCDRKSVDIKKKHWNKWIIERFQDFVLRYHEEIYPYYNDIKSEILSNDNIEPSIQDNFDRLYSLKI